MVAYTVEEWIAQGNQITILPVGHLHTSTKNTVKKKMTTAQPKAKNTANKTQQLVNNYRAMCWQDNDFHRYLGFIDALRALNKIDAEQYQKIYLQWLLGK